MMMLMMMMMMMMSAAGLMVQQNSTLDALGADGCWGCGDKLRGHTMP